MITGINSVNKAYRKEGYKNTISRKIPNLLIKLKSPYNPVFFIRLFYRILHHIYFLAVPKSLIA
jgi:hypothetical protein